MIPCNSDTLINPIVTGGTTPYTYLWNTGQSNSMLTLGLGNYQLTVTDLYGCSGSDDLDITYDVAPSVDLGADFNIPCNTKSLVVPIVVGGTAPYSYVWNTGDISSSLDLPEGSYQLTVTDIYGCSGVDDLEITYDAIPTADVSGGGSICDDGETTEVYFNFNGLLPWNLTYTMNGVSSTINNINTSNYTISTSTPGQYNITVADDINGCEADIIGSNIEIILNPVPNPIINPDFYELYPGEDVTLTAGSYAYYWWYTDNDALISESEFLFVDSTLTTYIVVENNDGCIGTSETAIVQFIPRVELFIPNTFTPNGDEHNELFVIKGRFITSFNMTITDRWGEMVYTTDKIDKYWDGKYLGNKCKIDSYIWTIEYFDFDNTFNTLKGHINLLE